MEKLKLCHISLGLYPDSRDGSAKFARGVYDELKRRGHDITMLTGIWNEGFDDPNIIPLSIPQARFFWAPKFLLKFRSYIKSHQFDLIHTNGSRGSLPVLFSKTPFITNIHDLGPFEANFTKIPVLKWLERRNAQKAARIITCSSIIHEGIERFMGAERSKMRNVWSAIDPRFQPEKKAGQQLKEKMGLKGPTLFYVGRIAFYKGIDHIIEAYYRVKKEIPDLNLVIGGKPELKLIETYQQWKTQYPEIRFVGMIPDEEMPIYYSMADAFITYSYASEGFGLTPVEAIACGTPVICSTMPAYREVLEDHAIFVEPQNPVKLAETISQFFHQQDLNHEKIKKAQEFIKRYSWTSVVDQIETIYQDFLQNYGK
jgi:phosphatidylinositol alpha-mannosyltransferase